MSTLVIHPKDSTTDFLKQIYAPIMDKTVITGGINKTELRQLIKEHDRTICCGHGTPHGLSSVGQFVNAGSEIIDDYMSDLFSEKEDNIYIWCHASEFMRYNQLCGFGTGMFISEVEEAHYFDFYNVDWETIDESNNCFSSIMSSYINHPLYVLYENVIHEYEELAETNPIAEFNLNRLFLNMNEQLSVIGTF